LRSQSGATFVYALARLMDYFDDFLRQRLQGHPRHREILEAIRSRTRPGERFPQTLVRLGVLPESNLGRALQLSWREPPEQPARDEETLLKPELALSDSKPTLAQNLLATTQRTADTLSPSVAPLSEEMLDATADPPALQALYQSTRHLILEETPTPRSAGRKVHLADSHDSHDSEAHEDDFFWPVHGARLNHLFLLRRLDEGGSAEVWKAWHENLRIHVAVKFLKRSLRSEDHEDRFFAEARAIASLNHPNIVRVFNCDKRRGCLYIEVEYIKGASLGALRRLAVKVSPKAAAEAALGASMALSSAWRRGGSLLHRDVKPDNIMVSIDGEIKLADFGLAQPVETASQTTEERGDRLYSSLAGTPAYMAPELLTREKPPSIQTDMYALGISLYQLCAGELPFHARSVAQMFRQHLTADPPKLSEKLPESERLSSIVDRLLRKKPEERYPSYNELIADLMACLDKSSDDGAATGGWGEPIHSPELGQLCRLLT
jgi:hypothetical protein